MERLLLCASYSDNEKVYTERHECFFSSFEVAESKAKKQVNVEWEGKQLNETAFVI